MAIQWNFSSEDYQEKTFTVIPVGDHRVRIQSAEEQTSNSGRQMIKLVLEVSGYNSTVWHFIVFMPENQKLTNQKLGEIFNSFGIQQGNFNLQQWVGKVGAAKIKHEEYNGESSAKVAYFINKDRQDKLPVWKEPNSASVSNNVAPIDNTGDLPFN